MKRARKLLLATILLAMIAPLPGCGVGTTKEDSKRTVQRSLKYDTRMLVDDLGLFAQVDRPLRTSRWVIE